MKVVLFCGGLGMRLYPQTENVPKPMINIGDRPILWNLMKYYSFFGHNEFILCLGYKGELIKEYFLNYNECLTNDFVYSLGGKKIELLTSDITDWKITFVNTGLHSSVGERLRAIEQYLDGEDIFLANYSDAVTDLYLPDLVDYFKRSHKIGCFLSVRPPHTFHICSSNGEGVVESISHVDESGIRINGGYFVFKKNIFNYIHENEDLVNEPFQRLINEKELILYEYDGFWANMDTYKDKQKLDDLYSNGEAYWEVWKYSANNYKRDE